MMQSVSQHASLVSLPCLPEIEDLITEHLLHDWVVRIEHAGKLEPRLTNWQQWGDTLYALKEPSQAMLSIKACRTGYPHHAIRIHAEKFSPQVHFVYWVYRHDTETRQTPTTNQVYQLRTVAEGQDWFTKLFTRGKTAEARVWRVVSMIGILLTSLFVLEHAIT